MDQLEQLVNQDIKEPLVMLDTMDQLDQREKLELMVLKVQMAQEDLMDQKE